MNRKNWLKFVIGWVAVFGYRLLPFRVPNVEPVLSVAMPFSKKYGAWGGFLFGALSIALFDIFVGKVGMWTLVTAATYGFIGWGAALFFKKRSASASNFLAYGVLGTIAYDAVTGVAMGPLLFGQTFAAAFFGQIPFTIMHLSGTIVFSLVISPLVYRWVVESRVLETDVVFSKVFGRAPAS